jgi:MoaA/NifB/PqqE/SkfB family radical SAM enzyme
MIEKRTHIFVSYSHKDKEWLERLNVHLRPLTREGRLDVWNDTQIIPGTEWRLAIQDAIANAKIAILLVSADFLASDFISENELPPLLQNAQEDGAHILSLIISPCRFHETRTISKYQAINPPSIPLLDQSRSDQERMFVKLSRTIDRILLSTEAVQIGKTKATPNNPVDSLGINPGEAFRERPATIVHVAGGRGIDERIKSFEYILRHADEDTLLIILGRSLVDWSDLSHLMEEMISKKKLHIKLALLDERAKDTITRPSPREWAYDDVQKSMRNFRRIKVNPGTGKLEVYGLDFYLSHSFISYTDDIDGFRHCIEEAGMALPVNRRPFIEVRNEGRGDDVYGVNLEAMYSALLTKERLMISNDGTYKLDISDEASNYTPVVDNVLVAAKPEDLLLINRLRARISNALLRWANPDLLRGSWERVISERSVEIFESLFLKGSLLKINPISAHYEIINKCNSRCKHCRRWGWHISEPPEEDQVISLLVSIASLNVETVTIGGGEPLLYQPLEKIIPRAKGLGLHIGIITNGLTLEKRLIGSICDNIEWVRFSIDGADEVTYESTRGSKSGLGRATLNLRRLAQSRYLQRNGQPTIGINFVIQHGNTHQLQDILDVGKECHADVVIFKLIHGIHSQMLNGEDLDSVRLQVNNLLSSDVKIKNNLECISEMINKELHDEDIMRGYPIETFYSRNNYRCFAPFFFLTVDSDGYIYPCDYLMYDTRDEMQFQEVRDMYRMGHIHDLASNNGVISVDMEKVINKVHYINTEMIPECGCCTRFYRFNALMTDLYRAYENIAKNFDSYKAGSFFRKVIEMEIKNHQRSWL